MKSAQRDPIELGVGGRVGLPTIPGSNGPDESLLEAVFGGRVVPQEGANVAIKARVGLPVEPIEVQQAKFQS